MKKVYVLHENDEWTKPLLDALKELQVPYEDWHLHEGFVPLDEEPPDGIFYNRMSASSHSRGHRFAPELTAAVLNWLERHNRTVLNGSRALYLEISKAAQYESLKQFDIAVPKTIAAVGDAQLLQAAEKMETPFITKHNRAGKGLGVQRFDDTETLKRTLEAGSIEPSVDGVMLLQQYIAAPDSSIVRCEFINGKFMYAVRVDTSEGFELCPADVCQIDDQFCPTTEPDSHGASAKPKFEIIEDFQSPLIEKYEAFLRHNQISFAAIEQITDASGKTFTYDVNTNTNYNKDAERLYGVSGMQELAKSLQHYAEQNVTAY